MTSPKARPNKQKRMPKRRSVWPSMPRKLTWERSGSFKLASPPASSARAEAAARRAKAAGAANLENLCKPAKQGEGREGGSAAPKLPHSKRRGRRILRHSARPLDQAFVSQVRIQNPPFSRKNLRSQSNLGKVFGMAAFRTLTRPSAFERRPRIEFCLIPPARGRRAPVRVTPRYRRRGACKTGRQGKHESQFYNILEKTGQTASRRSSAASSPLD